MKTINKTTGLSLAVAAAALLAGCASTQSVDTKAAMAADDSATKAGKCAGINSCKGHSDCNTANSSCKGQNECKGQGWVSLTKAECEAKGGTFSS